MSSPREGWRRWSILVVAVLGAAAGSVVTRRPAHACSCVEDSWQLRLRGVTSDVPAVSHEAYWPLEGELSSYMGHASIWALGAPQGQLHLVQAGQW